MSLIYVDGFDHYDVTNGVGHKIWDKDSNWLTTNDTNQNDHGSFATMPSLGSNCLSVRAGGDANPGAATGIALPFVIGTGKTVGVAFHLYMSALPASGRQGLWGFGSGIGTQTKSIGISTGGQLNFQLRQPDGGTIVLTSGANVLSAGVLYHIEAKMVCHASAGTIEVRVNGVTFMSGTALNTLDATSNLLLIAPHANAAQTNLWYYDDLFVWDEAGSINNNFMGENTVYTLFPSADTANADWTKSTGTDGFDLINDTPAVDTRYIEGGTVGNISIFDLTNLPTTALTIKGVRTTIRGEKTDALGGTIDFGPKHGGTASLLSAAQSNGSFKYYSKINELNPSTSAAWTPTEINATQIELSRTA